MPSFLAVVVLAALPTYRLVDSVGEPVRGATVRVVGGSTVSRTNERGQFRLDPPPPPPFDLAVFGAQGALIGHVRVPDRNSLVLVLQVIGSESVTVRGSPLPATSPSPAAAATKLSRETLEADPPILLADALGDVPGASNAGGGHTGVPSLRGMARGRTLVLLDDARVTAERRAGPSAGFLDPTALDSIEAVRGPGSLAYGPDGFGGVIHLRTPQPSLEGAAGRARATVGSIDESAALLVEQSVPLGRGAVLAQLHARRFDDYESPEGVVDNSAARDRGILLRGLLPAGVARLSLGLQMDRAFDVGRPTRTGLPERTFYPEEDSDRLTFSADLPAFAGSDLVEIRAFAGRYRLVTARETASAAGRLLEEADVEANDASLRAVGTTRVGLGTLRFGIDGHSRFGLEATGVRRSIGGSGETLSRESEVSIENARRVGGGAFVEAERSFASDRAHVVAGVRGDLVRSRNRGGFFGDREASHEALSGLLAVTVRFAPAAGLTLQYVRGFREPTLSDRYFRGISGRGFVVGNPELEPEKSDQFDAALRAALSERASLAISGYLYRIRDVVERFREGPDFRFRNRGEQEVRGAELEAGWNPHESLELSAGLSWARGRLLDDDSFAADVPAPSAVFTARHSPFERFWWRLRARIVARDDEPGPTEIETPSQEVVDLSAGVAVATGLEVVVLGSNLTDERYPLSSDADAPPAPGRSVGLSLQARW
jgi:outer membrane receptor protein involved in Fe transport